MLYQLSYTPIPPRRLLPSNAGRKLADKVKSDGRADFLRVFGR